MPTACMCAYMMVEPTKLNPRRLRSLLNASNSSDVAGISLIAFHRFRRGRPSTNRQPYGRIDLHPISNDRRVSRERLDSLLRVSCHLPRIELAEGAAIAFPFLEHDRPTEPGLRRFEHEEFEVLAIIMDRHTPFAIVVVQHQRIVADPGASVDPPLRHDSSTSPDTGDVVSAAALTG